MGKDLSSDQLDRIKTVAEEQLKHCNRVVVFDEEGTILHSNYEVDKAEIGSLPSLYSSRDTAIKEGITLGGMYHEVHQFQPPLIYGRTHAGEICESSEGIAMLQTETSPTGKKAYIATTYLMPNVSAYIITRMQDFAQKALAES